MFSSMVIQFLIKPKIVYFQECWIFYHGLETMAKSLAVIFFLLQATVFISAFKKKSSIS